MLGKWLIFGTLFNIWLSLFVTIFYFFHALQKDIYVCMYVLLSIYKCHETLMSHLFMWDTQEILCYLFRMYYFYYCSSEIEKSKHFIYNKRTHNYKLRSFFFLSLIPFLFYLLHADRTYFFLIDESHH